LGIPREANNINISESEEDYDEEESGSDRG